MALKSGFFNSLLVDGKHDRRYNADDYASNMGAIIRSGVLRDAHNGFRVTASGLVLSVSPGRAWIEGHWANLDAVYTFQDIVPPVGGYSRIDSVHLVLDTNINARKISLEYRQGIPATPPVAPNLLRSNGIYEICLARVMVNPNATTVSITDCRPIESLCGWVTSPIGYDEYFANLDAEFTEWFGNRRNDLSSVCLYKQYVWRTVLTSSSNSVVFDIPQYDPTGVDIIQVYVNGLLEVEGVDYTLTGRGITFIADGAKTGTKIAGTEIVVICYKSIDGTGLGTVVNGFTKLQNDVAILGNIAEYNYICNGFNDNVILSQMAQDFLDGEADGKLLTIRVYGTLGMNAAYGGSGTVASPYKWFELGKHEYTTRRVAIDFCNTNMVHINCPDYSNNVLFYGNNIEVKNAKFDIKALGGSIKGFSSVDGRLFVEKCSLSILGKSDSYIAETGVFTDCYADVRNMSGYSCVFRPSEHSWLRIRGGEYRAYSVSGYVSAVVYVLSGQENTVVIANGCSLSSLAVDGFVQNYGIYDLSSNGSSRYRDVITKLDNNAPKQIMEIISAEKHENA